jgi:N-methylhydantoinase B
MHYFRPTTLAEAIAIRRRHDVTVIAGGTDIYPAATARRAWGEPVTGDILDLSAIAELRGIEDRVDHIHIGALATWSDVIRTPLLPLFDGLKRAAREVGGVQIQNRGTVVGNCLTASPAGDGIPNLLALDATFDIAGETVLGMPASSFFTGYRKTACGPQSLVTGIRIPKRAGRGHFLKLGARRYLVISIAMVAVTVETDDENRILSARIAVGACSAVAQRLGALEAAVIGMRLSEAADIARAAQLTELDPIDDIRASGAYRLAAARHLVADALRDLATPSARHAA